MMLTLLLIIASWSAHQSGFVKTLRQNVKEPRLGRHMLIIGKYDRSAIEASIHDYVAKCTGDEWRDIADRIARNLSWEFEDYRE